MVQKCDPRLAKDFPRLLRRSEVGHFAAARLRQFLALGIEEEQHTQHHELGFVGEDADMPAANKRPAPKRGARDPDPNKVLTMQKGVGKLQFLRQEYPEAMFAIC